MEWLSRQERPFAWYSLDRHDGDVGLFGEYTAAAVGSLTGSDSGLVSTPGEQTPDPRTMIATLVEDLADPPTGAALVLDDYHEIQSREVHEAVTYLVENLPDGVILVIVTRADPPLPLSRLRGRGRLREIRGADLRFTAEQVAEYVRSAAASELSADDLRLVTERSEGWICEGSMSRSEEGPLQFELRQQLPDAFQTDRTELAARDEAGRRCRHLQPRRDRIEIKRQSHLDQRLGHRLSSLQLAGAPAGAYPHG